MKLAAIWNVWDGSELLKYSIKSIKADVYIIVYQTVSNWGEHYDPYMDVLDAIQGVNSLLVLYTPTDKSGFSNETAKRNLGIQYAKDMDCTHFMHVDTDEMYLDFDNAKQQYINSGCEGSVCKIFTYFKFPTLRLETEDGYFVPFIHKLNSDTISGVKEYPYYVDPTRRINCNNVALLDVHMHHYSYIRKDITRKVNNSSARANIARGTIIQDYNNPNVAPGFYVKDFEKKLIEVPNYFNIFV